jgi:hypothetical protein
MDSKDWIAIIGIAVTLVVSSANLIYSLWTNKRTAFVNTVTNSRLKWIDSLRDKVSDFIAVSTRLATTKNELVEATTLCTLRMQRDGLLHQIVLHLNPNDPQDQKIKLAVDSVRVETDSGGTAEKIQGELDTLRDATAAYLKKEWNRVKKESTGKPT